MTRKRAIPLALAAALVSAPPASAAEPSHETLPTVGIGTGISMGNVFSGGPLSTSPLAIYVPLNVSEHVRLEPSFGYWYVGRGASTTVLEGSASKGGYSVDVALGGFYVSRPVRPFAVYLGGRLGLVFSGRSDELAGIVTDTSETDLYVNPTLGLEWSIIRAFSVGAEAQVAFRFYFNPSVTIGQTSLSVSRDKFGTGLESVVFVRLYL